MKISQNFQTRLIVMLVIALLAIGVMASTMPVQAQGGDATATPQIIIITATPSSTPMPGLVATSGTAGCGSSVTVKAGDNLFRIALSAGTSWPILAQLNNIPNPNLIFVGQVICLPSGVSATFTPTGVLPGGITATASMTPIVIGPTATPMVVIVTPGPATFPTITLSTHQAGSGDTVTITGLNFPANSPVDIYVNPLGAQLGTPINSAAAGPDGSLNITLAIPANPDGTPMHGAILTVTVKARTNGFYGYDSFYNTHP